MSKKNKKNKKRYSLPANAPRPQDHKPAADGAEVLHVEALGREWVVDTAQLDDDEFLERMGELQEGNPFVAPKVGKTLLGEEQYAAARELLRDPETGRVKASDMLEFVGAIMQGGAS